MPETAGVYATGVVQLFGRWYYAFASENRDGELYLVDCETHATRRIDGCSGGVMAVIAAVGEDSLITIEEFYPVFDSATAKLVRYTAAMDNGDIAVTREVLAQVPYIHRVAQLRGEYGVYLAAGRLCLHKTHIEDWSAAGTLEIGRYDGNNPQPVDFELLCEGIHKHHALWVKNVDGADELYYGGTEGVFHSFQRNGVWCTEQIFSAEVSDIVVEDLDGDGVDELAIIEGFHGNRCTVFKKHGGTWKRALELPMDFGHVLWGGAFPGGPALLRGSRSGKKQLVLNRFEAAGNGGIRMKEEIIIDEDQGPAQVTVVCGAAGASLIAANHGAGQAVLYKVE